MADAETGPSPRRRPSVGGMIAAAAHLLLLARTVGLILHAGDGPWVQHWVMFLAADFPVSLGVMPVTWLVPPSPAGPLHDLSNFWWPLLYHGTVGTGWWYIVGDYVQRRWRARRQR